MISDRRVTTDCRPAVGQLFAEGNVWGNGEGEVWEVRDVLNHCHVSHWGVGCLWLVVMVCVGTGEIMTFEVEQVPTPEYLSWKEENRDRLSKPSWWDSVVW